jgi:hypothetical protein
MYLYIYTIINPIEIKIVPLVAALIAAPIQTMTGGDDRLSDLPDDLLCRVLRFAPLKEAASTTVLSRRWRTPLWLSSGAVNLETRVEDYDRNNYGSNRDEEVAKFFSRRNAFVSAAVAALDAADDKVTRLTLRVKSCSDKPLKNFLNDYTDKGRVVSRDRNVVDVVLSHRAARRVEELRLVIKERGSGAYYDGETFRNRSNSLGGLYSITLESLPSETLRVLELTNCWGLYQCEATAIVLPRLSSLRLRHCSQYLSSLQRVIDAAPSLATVRLESVCVLVDATEEEARPARQSHCHGWHSTDDQNSGDDNEEDDPPTPPKEATHSRLRCPAATILVLERCRWEEQNDGRRSYGGYSDDDEKPVTLIGIEIDAPRLRRFRYKGLLRPFSFNPRPPELEQVDLHFYPDNNWRNKDPNRDLKTFWRFARSFTNTKTMSLCVKHLEDIAVLSEARRVELLPVFRRLERLELQGVHRPKGKTAAVAIANLLRCCPVLRDLQIDLTTEHHDATKRYNYAQEFLERKFRSDRDKSMDCLDRCSDSEPTIVAPEGIDLGANYDDLPDIPGLSRRRSTECLQTSLRRVGLKFQLEKSDSLGVRLIKFFSQNAIVLEEMHIDGGNKKFRDHINPKVERWIANSSERIQSRKKSFVVLPLNRLQGMRIL